jgi:hypothetical protein
MKRTSSSHRLLGGRLPRNQITPDYALRGAITAREQLANLNNTRFATLAELRMAVSGPCRAYYTAAAVSRRRELDDQDRAALLDVLFPLRASIERSTVHALNRVDDAKEVLQTACGPSFFGASQKQGVSIRYPLLTCTPTARCAGGCYGHDGRDRELHLVVRGALNYWLGARWEQGTAAARADLLRDLGRAVSRAVRLARLDADNAAASGFVREPRIRFAHVGEMAATPHFTNALATEIKRVDPGIACVIYTRHPNARLLDADKLRVNFTIESADDARIRYVPPHARIVSSAWDGQIVPVAEVNFLEHHVEKHATAYGQQNNNICPVTSGHGLRSCDSARCEKCFRAPSSSRSVPLTFGGHASAALSEGGLPAAHA